MKRTVLVAALAAAAAGIVIAVRAADDAGKTAMPMTDAKPSFYSVDKIEWKEGPKSLPPGAMIAVLEGDPAKDGPFTMRAKIPDGFKIPPHFHPKTEHVTVLSGSFNIGTGDKFDMTTTKELTAGAFMLMPVGMPHYVWFKGETIIQINGVGPWGINYLNPADDPRNATK